LSGGTGCHLHTIAASVKGRPTVGNNMQRGKPVCLLLAELLPAPLTISRPGKAALLQLLLLPPTNGWLPWRGL
jgi:hypothetical protein